MENEIEVLKRQVAELQAMLAQNRAAQDSSILTPYEAAVPVTTCILAHNNWRHLPEVMAALWRQDVRQHVLTCVDASSIDPTEAILSWSGMERYLVTHRSGGIASYRYLGTIPHQELEEQVMAHAKAKFADECKTEYIFYLDADVVLADGTLRLLLDQHPAHGGVLAVPYNLVTSHILQGAILLKTELARNIPWNGSGKCVCVNLAQTMKERGLSFKHYDGPPAIHLKWRH